MGADFLTTLCALYSFSNALYVELVRKIIILKGEEESWCFMVDKLIFLVSASLPNESGVRGLPLFFLLFFLFFVRLWWLLLDILQYLKISITEAPIFHILSVSHYKS